MYCAVHNVNVFRLKMNKQNFSPFLCINAIRVVQSHQTNSSRDVSFAENLGKQGTV